MPLTQTHHVSTRGSSHLGGWARLTNRGRRRLLGRQLEGGVQRLARLRARAVDVVVLVLRGRLALARQALQRQGRLPLHANLLQQCLQAVHTW